MTHPTVLDACTDSCGWVAAILAALCYGSYGVPIKETKKLDVHPLVFQSYKTCTMFFTSWLVLWLGVTPAWTPWGLVSGTLWVLGGTGGVYAVRMAGMAIAVGTWASVMILVNFVWGILVFQEPVANIWATVGAFALLTLGLVGMSHYSAPAPKTTNTTTLATTATATFVSNDDDDDNEIGRKIIINENRNMSGDSNDDDDDDDDLDPTDLLLDRNSNSHNNTISDRGAPSILMTMPHARSNQAMLGGGGNSSASTTDAGSRTYGGTSLDPRLRSNNVGENMLDGTTTTTTTAFALLSDPDAVKKRNAAAAATVDSSESLLTFAGITMTRRTAGMWGAVFNGLMTGTSLIPLHYAKKQGFGGAHYMISFATGALIANILIWIVFYMAHVAVALLRPLSKTSTSTASSFETEPLQGGGVAASRQRQQQQQQQQQQRSKSVFVQAYDDMPFWYMRELWFKGFCAGLLLALAMFGSIIAVTYLGQGIGNSVVQSKILISGLWGIFWYKEIHGERTITMWFASASLTILGILWLSHERLIATEEEAKEGAHRLLAFLSGKVTST